MFNKADAIYLQLVYFSTKLFCFGFFATYNGAYVGFAQRNNPVFYLLHPAIHFAVLLLIYPDNETKLQGLFDG